MTITNDTTETFSERIDRLNREWEEGREERESVIYEPMACEHCGTISKHAVTTVARMREIGQQVLCGHCNIKASNEAARNLPEPMSDRETASLERALDLRDGMCDGDDGDY